MASSAGPYAGWSAEELTARIMELERQLKEVNENNPKPSDHLVSSVEPPSSRPAKKPRIFDWSKHSTRHIALKFAYIGKKYNGYEHHANNTTPLPTVEETIWHALMKAKLINPAGNTAGRTNVVDWEGCDYSKCGRTDRGVSAFGQVIGIRVRSNRPLSLQGSTFDEQIDELPYVQILNSILPADIRVLAWCPTLPEDFSARFSCRSRHYKYYFTQPAFTPTPGAQGLRLGKTMSADARRREGWLDIKRMQDAAKRFEGLHDFRNFCKVDPSKQIHNYERRIYHSEIRALIPEEVPTAYISDSLFRESNLQTLGEHQPNVPQPQLYVFDLQGSAFLWHQVRHMIAILFLIGQGLEAPSVVDDLMDIKSCSEKPHYEIADDAPLVLWNCTFPREGDDPLTDSLSWRYVGDVPPLAGRTGSGSAKFGIGGAVDVVWKLWREAKMDEILRGSLLNLIVRQPDALSRDLESDLGTLSTKPGSQRVFLGSSGPEYRGKHVPLLMRERMRPVEEVNREYAEKHGLPDKETGEAVRRHPEGVGRNHAE